MRLFACSFSPVGLVVRRGRDRREGAAASALLAARRSPRMWGAAASRSCCCIPGTSVLTGGPESPGERGSERDGLAPPLSASPGALAPPRALAGRPGAPVGAAALGGAGSTPSRRAWSCPPRTVPLFLIIVQSTPTSVLTYGIFPSSRCDFPVSSKRTPFSSPSFPRPSLPSSPVCMRQSPTHMLRIFFKRLVILDYRFILKKGTPEL